MKKLNLVLSTIVVSLLLVGCTSVRGPAAGPTTNGYSQSAPQATPPLPPLPATASTSSKKLKNSEVLASSKESGLPRKAVLTGGIFMVSNPPPRISFAWNASPSTNILAGYNMYIGTASRRYTMTQPVANVLTVGYTNTFGTNVFQRGVTYYATVTALDTSGLESDFSNEVNWIWGVPPMSPTLSPTVLLSIQKTISLTEPVMWADTSFDWVVPSNETLGFFRLKIAPQ